MLLESGEAQKDPKSSPGREKEAGMMCISTWKSCLVLLLLHYSPPVVLGCVFGAPGCANLRLLLLKEARGAPGVPGSLHSKNLSLFSLGLSRSAAP